MQATDWLAARISAQCTAAPVHCRYSLAQARVLSLAVAHQPCAVSLSCVLL